MTDKVKEEAFYYPTGAQDDPPISVTHYRVVHPTGFTIRTRSEAMAKTLVAEINAGRAALQSKKAETNDR